MAKKRTIKKVNSSFKIPESFSALNFKNKIISVVLLVLIVGIIGSLFPGNLTGSAIFNNYMFSQIKYTLDNIIRTVFPMVPSANIIIYEKFVLFLLLFTLLSWAAKLLNFRGMTNFVVAGAISLISVWFIPPEVLAMIGLTYGGVYASLLMLIPIFTVGYLAWFIPGTKGGCWAKAIIYFVLLSVFGATRDGLRSSYSIGEWYNTYADTIIVVLFILTVYYVIRALTISVEAEQKAKRKWLEERSEQNIANIILTKVEEGIKGGSERAGRYAASGRD